MPKLDCNKVCPQRAIKRHLMCSQQEKSWPSTRYFCHAGFQRYAGCRRILLQHLVFELQELTRSMFTSRSMETSTFLAQRPALHHQAPLVSCEKLTAESRRSHQEVEKAFFKSSPLVTSVSAGARGNGLPKASCIEFC